MKTDAQFWLATGNWPIQDDMERANCPRYGKGMIDHTFCGWCEIHDKPRSQCGECMKALVAWPETLGEVGTITQEMWDSLKPTVANRQTETEGDACG